MNFPTDPSICQTSLFLTPFTLTRRMDGCVCVGGGVATCLGFYLTADNWSLSAEGSDTRHRPTNTRSAQKCPLPLSGSPTAQVRVMGPLILPHSEEPGCGPLGSSRHHAAVHAPWARRVQASEKLRGSAAQGWAPAGDHPPPGP